MVHYDNKIEEFFWGIELQNPEECDATDDDSSTEAGLIKNIE